MELFFNEEQLTLFIEDHSVYLAKIRKHYPGPMSMLYYWTIINRSLFDGMLYEKPNSAHKEDVRFPYGDFQTEEARKNWGKFVLKSVDNYLQPKEQTILERWVMNFWHGNTSEGVTYAAIAHMYFLAMFAGLEEHDQKYFFDLYNDLINRVDFEEETFTCFSEIVDTIDIDEWRNMVTKVIQRLKLFS